MKISGITVYEVKPRWIFVKITTDEGIEGWGEMISGTKTETVVAGAKEMGEYLLGRGPFEIERLWQEMYKSFFRGGPINGTIVSGMEMALWDIKGKAFGVPVYEFLGGKARDRIKVYSWIGGDRPDDVAKAALERRAMGFDAVKMNATEELHYIDSFAKIQAVVDRVASIREACGNDFGIAVDFHGRVHKPMAKVLAHELEPYKLMFMEEVVLPENEEGFREVANQVSTPLATGERLVSRWQYKNLFREGAIDIIQPDVALVGGILETKKLGDLAQTYGVRMALHQAATPIHAMAAAHIGVATENCWACEFHANDVPWWDDLIVSRMRKPLIQNGFIEVPDLPGLGIDDMNDEVIAEHISQLNPGVWEPTDEWNHEYSVDAIYN